MKKAKTVPTTLTARPSDPPSSLATAPLSG
jgi:hypothetical protein